MSFDYSLRQLVFFLDSLKEKCSTLHQARSEHGDDNDDLDKFMEALTEAKLLFVDDLTGVTIDTYLEVAEPVVSAEVTSSPEVSMTQECSTDNSPPPAGHSLESEPAPKLKPFAKAKKPPSPKRLNPPRPPLREKIDTPVMTGTFR